MSVDSGTEGASDVVVIPTGHLHGYQVIFSPYTPHKLAFVGGCNYGIAGAALIFFAKL